MHGDGVSKRSYLHVKDVAAAFDIVLHKGVTGSTYNIGTAEEHAVIDIAAWFGASEGPFALR